jgi:transposase
MEKGRLQRRYGRPKLKRVRRLAIDEIAVRKGHVYLTVVLDLESGAVLFVGNGKGKKALLPFWKRLRGSGAKIEAVAIDMSPAYEAAVREHLPQAVLVYDRFHVVKLFNHMLSELRREQYSLHKDQTERDLLKGTRWLLLKDPEHLRKDKDEKKRLEEALTINQTLATAYYLKELFREAFWNCRNHREAARFLDNWLAAAQASGIRLVIGLALTLQRHRQGLLNYYRFPISTGPLEGVNNKIKTLKRQAYGYRDPEFFKLKILALHQCKYSLTG